MAAAAGGTATPETGRHGEVRPLKPDPRPRPADQHREDPAPDGDEHGETGYPSEAVDLFNGTEDLARGGSNHAGNVHRSAAVVGTIAEPGAAATTARDQGRGISRISLAGAPATIEKAGTSETTTLLAPTTQRSPMVTPLVTVTLAPSQQFGPILVGPLVVNP